MEEAINTHLSELALSEQSSSSLQSQGQPKAVEDESSIDLSQTTDTTSSTMTSTSFTTAGESTQKVSILEQMMAIFGDDIWDDKEEVERLKADFVYTGFKPVKVIEAITAIGGDQLNDDLKALAVMYHESCTNRKKLAQKMKNSAKLRNLAKKYKLHQGVPTETEQLTLSRIALSFPWVICSYMQVAPSTVVPLSALPAGYPKPMMTAAFGALIPERHLAMRILVKVYLIHQYKFSRIINRASPRKTTAEVLSEALKYTLLAMRGCAHPDSTKLAFLRKFKLVEVDGGVAASVSNLYTSFESSDPALAAAINLAVIGEFGLNVLQ